VLFTFGVAKNKLPSYSTVPAAIGEILVPVVNVSGAVVPALPARVIVLFVKVSVVARPTSTSVDVGRVSVPVFTIVEITGDVSVADVSVLFVNTSVPAKVARVPDAGRVTEEPPEAPVRVTAFVRVVKFAPSLSVLAAFTKSRVRVLSAVSVVLDVAAILTSYAALVSRTLSDVRESTVPALISPAVQIIPTNIYEPTEAGIPSTLKF
jgi:hypothetical protein